MKGSRVKLVSLYAECTPYIRVFVGMGCGAIEDLLEHKIRWVTVEIWVVLERKVHLFLNHAIASLGNDVCFGHC